MNRSAARLIATAAALLPLTLAACGDDPDQRSESNYCTQVGNHLTELNSPTIAAPGDIDRVVDAWRAVARSAPLAIEPEWEVMMNNLETAVTVDPADPASIQKVADTARQSEQAANRVISYTQQRCGALIGSVTPTATTLAPTPTDTVAVTTTT